MPDINSKTVRLYHNKDEKTLTVVISGVEAGDALPVSIAGLFAGVLGISPEIKDVPGLKPIEEETVSPPVIPENNDVFEESVQTGNEVAPKDNASEQKSCETSADAPKPKQQSDTIQNNVADYPDNGKFFFDYIGENKKPIVGNSYKEALSIFKTKVMEITGERPKWDKDVTNNWYITRKESYQKLIQDGTFLFKGFSG